MTQAPTQAAISSTDAAWNKTSIRLSHLQEQLREEICFKDDLSFVGCLASIQSLVLEHAPPLLLCPDSLPAGGLPQGDPCSASPAVMSPGIGRAKLVAFQASDNGGGASSFQAQIGRVKADHQSRYKNWFKAFNERSKNEPNSALLDFAALLKWIDAEILGKNPASRAHRIADAISAYLAATDDQNSSLFPMQALVAEYTTVNESHVGTGAMFSVKNGDMIVVTQIDPGSPADSSFVLGDRVLRVNSKNLSAENLFEVFKGIPKVVGQEVLFTVKRFDPRSKTWKELDLTLKLAPLIDRNVIAETLDGPEGKLGYLRLTEIKRETAKMMRQELKHFDDVGVQGLILDLRGSPGGSELGTQNILSLFAFPDEEVFRTRVLQTKILARPPELSWEVFIHGLGLSPDLTGSGIDENHQRTLVEASQAQDKVIAYGTSFHAFAPTGEAKAIQLPTLVLIDSGTRSLSEIIAASLRQLKKAYVLGERSYGKATLLSGQPWPALPKEIFELKAFAKIEIPGGGWDFQSRGITPDFELPRSLDPVTPYSITAIREEDGLYKPLPPQTHPQPHPRPRGSQALRECMTAKSDFLRSIFEKTHDLLTGPGDYQKISVTNAFDCLKKAADAERNAGR